MYSIHESKFMLVDPKKNIFIMLLGNPFSWKVFWVKNNFFITFHYLEDIFFYIYKFLKLNREDAYQHIFVIFMTKVDESTAKILLHYCVMFQCTCHLDFTWECMPSSFINIYYSVITFLKTLEHTHVLTCLLVAREFCHKCAYSEFVLLDVCIYWHIVDILTCFIVIAFWRKG